MEKFLKYFITAIILSSIGLTFFSFFYIAYINFTDDYTIVYKGPVEIIDTFHEPARTERAFRGNVHIPERNGLKLHSNILKSELQTSHFVMNSYRNILKDGEKHNIDVIIVLRETSLPNLTFEKEVQMFFVKDDPKYKVGGTYKP